MHRISLIGLILGIASSAFSAEPSIPIGTEVAGFTASDYRGKEHRLAGFASSKVLVLAVVGTECPLAKLYASRLQELSQKYADRGVAFIGLDANAHDSMAEIEAYARRHGLTFPVLKDAGNKIVDAVGATRTPEVVLLDADRAIRYRGRIDDQYGIGYAKPAPSQNYLADAIDAVLAGEQVETTSVTAIGCLIGRARKPAGDSEFTYTRDVAAILNERCVECHREGEIAPFALTDYESAAGWAPMIAEVVQEGRMPPWHAAPPVSGSESHDGAVLEFVSKIGYANERRLSQQEKDALVEWAAAGAPRGDGTAPPPAEDKIADWLLPQTPDAVLQMADEPYAVPAEGVVKYQYFRVDPGFDEDKWIAASEVVPGNRSVVHHVLVFAREKGSRNGRGEGGGGFLAAYVPGLKPAVYPAGMAKRIPAGSEIVFQVHYTPVGSEQTDLTRIGLVFADPADIECLVETRNAVQPRLDIVPGKAGQKFQARDSIPYDNASLLACMPHMHLRGQAFRYTLQRDGEAKTLLDVPHYDFNWQTGYALVEPLPLHKGDRIFCEAWFDNSDENLANPDPTANVGWGDQTWNEMMIGYYDVAVPLDEQSKDSARTGRLSTVLRDRLGDRVGERVRDLLKRYDADGDEGLTVEEVPGRMRPLHAQFDKDADGRVTAEELRPLAERQ